MPLQEKAKRLNLTPLPTPEYPLPVPMLLDDQTQPEEIQQVVKQVNV